MNQGQALQPSGRALLFAFLLTPLIVLPAYLVIEVVISLYHFFARSPGPAIAPALYHLLDPSGWKVLAFIWAGGAVYTYVALALFGVPAVLVLSRFRLATLPIVVAVGALGGTLIRLGMDRRYFTAEGALPFTFFGAAAAAFFWWLASRSTADPGSILSGSGAP